jgi:hypothetical protein
MSGLFMLGKDLEALLMDGNTVLEMIIRAFYLGLSTKSNSYVDLKSGKNFLELTTAEAKNLLDGILLERKNYDGLNATNIPSEPFDDRYEIYERVEEVKNALR